MLILQFIRLSWSYHAIKERNYCKQRKGVLYALDDKMNSDDIKPHVKIKMHAWNID